MFYNAIKKFVKGVLTVDWLQFIQIICIPAFGWLFYEIGRIRRELEDFKIEVAKDAKNYATNDAIQRVENKIDDLRDLIIEEIKGTKKAKR